MKLLTGPNAFALITFVITVAITMVAGFFLFPDASSTVAYWIALWSALFAGAIISVPVLVFVSRRLAAWQQQGDRVVQQRETKRACDALRDDLRLFLSQSDTYSMQTAEKTVPEYMHRIESLLEDKPLTDWSARADADDKSFLKSVTEFRQAHADFVAACYEVEIAITDFTTELRERQTNRHNWHALNAKQVPMYFIVTDMPEDKQNRFILASETISTRLNIGYEAPHLASLMSALPSNPTTFEARAYFRQKRADLIARADDIARLLRVEKDPDHPKLSPNIPAISLVGRAGGRGTVTATISAQPATGQKPPN